MKMNCIIIDDDELSRKILEEFVERTDFLKLEKSYSNAVDAINTIKSGPQIDLIFLDIEMPEMSGIEFLSTLDNAPMVIIVSSKEKYALQSYEYDVSDYLLKPVSYARFFQAIEKVKSRFASIESGSNSESDEIFIKKASSLVKLKYDEILWVEALENYIVIHTYNEKYTIHFTMKAIAEKLPSSNFIRVHRSYIANINKIKIIEDNTIVMKTDTGTKLIPIGKSYKERLLNDINLINK